MFSARLRHGIWIFLVFSLCLLTCAPLFAADLEEVKRQGELRHLGVRYANFITGSGDGLEVDVMRRFSAHLGVSYRFVPSTWPSVLPDLTGKRFRVNGDDVEVTGQAPIRGDVIASGLTILPWREKLVDFSTPTFATQVWLVTAASSPIAPISPGKDLKDDIRQVKSRLAGLRVLTKPGTCLDPELYGLETTGATFIPFDGNLNDLAPAVIHGEADATLLDVPDALVALFKWPGKTKVIGPVSGQQKMACAFRKDSPELRAEFDRFFKKIQKDGTFERLVRKYYPAVTDYYPNFFDNRAE